VPSYSDAVDMVKAESNEQQINLDQSVKQKQQNLVNAEKKLNQSSNYVNEATGLL